MNVGVNHLILAPLGDTLAYIDKFGKGQNLKLWKEDGRCLWVAGWSDPQYPVFGFCRDGKWSKASKCTAWTDFSEPADWLRKLYQAEQ